MSLCVHAMQDEQVAADCILAFARGDANKVVERAGALLVARAITQLARGVNLGSE